MVTNRQDKTSRPSSLPGRILSRSHQSQIGLYYTLQLLTVADHQVANQMTFVPISSARWTSSQEAGERLPNENKLNSSNWAILSEIKTLLKPFKNITKMLKTDNRFLAPFFQPLTI